MNRRQFLTAAAGAAATVPLVRSAGAKRPNVIILISDDQGYGDLGCHGNPVIKTPNLDALHARSVRFTNFHVSPTCAPTRSAMMTGRYSNSTGVWHTIMGRSLLAHDEVTMADCFRGAGYRTGIFGKWHLGDNFPCRPQDRGFDEVVIHGGGGIWQTPDYFGNDYTDDVYFHNGKPEAYKGFCTDVWFDNAMRFIGDAARQKKPFFAYVPTNAPHGPMWAPPSYEDRYREVKGLKEPGFYGMITNFDDNVARLVDFLRKNDLEQDTILIYMTDNGTAAGAQVHNAGMRGTKGSPYEGGHRVPFFVSWPGGNIGKPRDVDTLTAHIDVLPTMMEICGLKRPKGLPMHGRSLRPLLTEEKPRWEDRVIVTDSQRLENLVPWRQAAVMTQQWRLVSPGEGGKPAQSELYDIQKDPGQKNNIASAHPDVVARLTAEYEKWWKQTSARGDEYVRIVLGDPRAGEVRLTCHDWHGEGVMPVWNQHGVRLGPATNGFWAVELAQAGPYRIELRRWPKEVDLPVSAPYRDAKPNREQADGKAVPVSEARLEIGPVKKTVPVKETDKAAVFEVRLPKGPAELRTFFRGPDGTERGAYYAYVTRA